MEASIVPRHGSLARLRLRDPNAWRRRIYPAVVSLWKQGKHFTSIAFELGTGTGTVKAILADAGLITLTPYQAEHLQWRERVQRRAPRRFKYEGASYTTKELAALARITPDTMYYLLRKFGDPAQALQWARKMRREGLT